MALRVGGGTRSATFETQSEFFRKESTEMDFPASQEWRSLLQFQKIFLFFKNNLELFKNSLSA